MTNHAVEILSERLVLRLHPSEIAALDARAAEAGQSRSRFVRVALRAALGKRRPVSGGAAGDAAGALPPLEPLLAEAKRLHADLARSGGLLNQVARKLNAADIPDAMFRPPSAREVREALDAHGETMRGLAAAVALLEQAARAAAREIGVLEK
jgi:hypothetical protein